MPRRGGDWPPVEDMVAADQRLVVFSSDKTKEESEGIAYQGNFVVEYKCFTRYSKKNSKDLMNAVHQCHPIGSDHWANFIAVDYAEGVDDVGPAFEAVNFLNGKLLCGCDDVNSCRNTSLPYNKYAFLTTHRSYASSDYHYTYKGRYLIGAASEDSVTQQLNVRSTPHKSSSLSTRSVLANTSNLQSGVRALMLNPYSMNDDLGLCRNCKPIDYNKYIASPAHDFFQEVEEFLTSNPSEIVTLFLQDEVETPNGLAKIFNATGLTKYMLPLTKMPRHGGDWPLINDMVAANQRLVVFSSAKTKEESEGIGYQGNFVVEYHYGSPGMDTWNCKYLAPQKKKSSKSLVLLNYPSTQGNNRYGELMKAIHQCHTCASGNWPNFIAVDYAEGIDVEPAFQAVNFLNGKLLCGCDDVNSCKRNSYKTNGVSDYGEIEPSIAVDDDAGWISL
ncbi:hypothetical protein Vadar_006071 [Vaccinium darrowii]|uniref:Uncharacterized protein n=1 Tax=Vaccinium darrowii TaxID=229202 RepID=A0ACB7YUC5_9ERIC|nr:hypothetical protein Vadar_006071 [Vaccinium darrowii]